MREQFGNIWDVQADALARNVPVAVVITTNGAVRNDGACVMGRGVAAQAKDRYPGIEFALGDSIKRKGNHVARLISAEGDVLFSFPVKHHWREQADPSLILRSAIELSTMYEDPCVLLPRPGCGNGGRSWNEIKLIIEPTLDDRFIVVALP